MTITILCAGALARPAAQRADIEPDPSTPQAAWLPSAKLRDELRAASRPALPAVLARSSLARTLRRARVASRTHLDAAAPPELPCESWLRARFGAEGSIAAYALPPSPSTEPEVVVRPVHLHVGLDHLVLAPLAQLDVETDEARSLAAAANEWLAAEGIELDAERADVWRLRACASDPSDTGPAATDSVAAIAAIAALRSPSARNASGRNIDAWQPSGDAARRWRQLNNLVQMSWFEHPVNLARERHARPAINALWLEGHAGALRERPFERVWTDDEAIAGLARRADARTTLAGLDDPSAARELLAPDRGRPTETLLAPGFWRRATDEGDAAAWSEGWQRFADWFEHAIPASARRPALRLVLTGERDTIEIEHRSSDRWKPWRRLHLAALVEDAR